MAVSIGDYLVRRRLKHLVLHVTNACNFRCAHCFVDFETPKRDLPLEHYLRLGAETPPLLWLDIGGGEPFLRKDLPDIICAFQSDVVHIPTNGSLLPRMLETLDRLQAKTDREINIGLSLDGLRDTHDQIRGKSGSFDQVWESFEALRSRPGISVKITTVLNNRNYAEIIPLMHEVQRRGADFHSVILMRGHVPDPMLALPSLAELHRLAPEMFQILQRYDYGQGKLSAHLLRNYHRFLWKTSLAILEEERQVIPCLGGQAHLVVNGDGGVSSCEMLPSVGNVKDQGFDAILASKPFRQQVESIRRKECHCTHNCALFDSTFFSPTSVVQLAYQPPPRSRLHRDAV